MKLFKNIAAHYDFMSDLMSLFLHRWWKNQLIKKAAIKNNETILDLAAGTGDVSLRILKNKDFNGKIQLVDLNKEMLEIAKTRLNNYKNLEFIVSDAENLPLADNSLDLILVSLGFRHFVNQNLVLQELFRILKPQGRILILDFYNSKNKFLSKIYNFYLNKIISCLAELLLKQGKNYQYLALSINSNHSQDYLLTTLIENNFIHCEFKNIFLDLVAIHSAVKNG